MNHISNFKNLEKNVRHAVGKAKSLNIVFNRIHHQFAYAIKGTGMSRACYTVSDDAGNEFIMKVEHNTHTDQEEWEFLVDANAGELKSFQSAEVFPNLASVLMPIHAWFTVGDSLILIVPVMEVVPNVNTDEWKNSGCSKEDASDEWQNIYEEADVDCWNDDGAQTVNGKRLKVMHWLCNDVHEGNIGILDGLVYLIDYSGDVANCMDNSRELNAERLFAD